MIVAADEKLLVIKTNFQSVLVNKLMHLLEHNWWKIGFLFKNLILFITTKWCTNKEQKQPKTKARSLIFVKRGKPQGGCFPLAQGPVLWWPLPACRGLLLATMFDPRSLRSQQKRKKNKIWTLFGWVGRLLEAEKSGQRRTGPQFSAAAWKSKRHGNHSRNHSWDHVENLDMCHSRNLQSCVLWIRYTIPRNLTKLFWKWHIIRTKYWLGSSSEVSH